MQGQSNNIAVCRGVNRVMLLFFLHIFNIKEAPVYYGLQVQLIQHLVFFIATVFSSARKKLRIVQNRFSNKINLMVDKTFEGARKEYH